jgi:PAS domain S-box-containing protein
MERNQDVGEGKIMRVLIADDEAISRCVLEKMLTEWGYDVVSTSNGAEALQGLQADDAPKLAIVDWIMPEMDGIEVVRKVRSIATSTPTYIILLTVKEGSQNIIVALESGANDFISKPYDFDELRARLRVGERVVSLEADLAQSLEDLKDSHRKLSIYSDELEKKVAERTAELSTTNERLSLLLESLPVVVYTRSAKSDCGTTYMGNSVLEITGYSSEDLTSTPSFWTDRIHPDDAPRVLEGICVLLAKGRYEQEYRWRLADGTYKWFYDGSRLIKSQDGNISHIAGVLIDITERKRTEEELLRALDAAEAASRAKTEFIANISHEVRTPLNAVIGFSEVLQQELFGELNEKQHEYVRSIITGGQRLLDLILNILDLSATEFGERKLELSRFPLRQVLSESMLMFEDMAKKHNLSLDLVLEADVDTEIEADRENLKKIMTNLLSNAVKFTPEGGSLQVAARRLASFRSKCEASGSKTPIDIIEISVQDTGIGICPDDIPKLFTNFTQLESPYTKRYDGVGIGLALVKRLVELNGGTIWAESELGKGSKFVFVIPIGGDNERTNMFNYA